MQQIFANQLRQTREMDTRAVKPLTKEVGFRPLLRDWLSTWGTAWPHPHFLFHSWQGLNTANQQMVWKKLCLGWTLNTQKSQATGWWQAGLEALTISQGFQATTVNVVSDYAVRSTWDTFEIYFMHKSPNWITFSVIWKRTCVYLFGTLGHWFCRTKCYRSELHTQNKPLTAEKNWADFLLVYRWQNSSKKQLQAAQRKPGFYLFLCICAWPWGKFLQGPKILNYEVERLGSRTDAGMVSRFPSDMGILWFWN